MMADPELLLLDEPGAGVNPALMDELAAYILHLARDRGVTILLIEHDMDLVRRLCDPVIVLSEGQPLVEGPFAEVVNDPRVLAAYLGGS
jgi:ABC-type branched-subunit amino acid transport system ATPase component